MHHGALKPFIHITVLLFTGILNIVNRKTVSVPCHTRNQVCLVCKIAMHSEEKIFTVD